MKVTKGLIIRREGVELSEEYAKICADSCDKHGLPWEYIDAVQFLAPEEAYKSVGSFMKRQWNPTEGNACCHASMIKSWKRIVELDEACIILEHDALIVGDVTTVDIPDDAVVTFGFRVKHEDTYQPIAKAKELIQMNRSVGCHAYGLTPKTAKWLADDACNNGVIMGVDKWLMMQTASGLPLYTLDYPQAVCWVRKSSMPIGNKPSRGTPGWRNANVMLPPGWKKGMKRNE